MNETNKLNFNKKILNKKYLHIIDRLMIKCLKLFNFFIKDPEPDPDERVNSH